MVKTNDKSNFIKADICKENRCKGCGACVNICPQKCLTLVPNEYGEDIPFVSIQDCRKCGLCNGVCPENKSIEKEEPQLCFAGWRKDCELRSNSSSGGIASVLAEQCFYQGWHVYGTVYDINKGATFIECCSIDDIISLRGSKYVQSDMGYIYPTIKEGLLNNEQSIFFGTPCQVAGLKSYLAECNINFVSKIVFVDFLCHGCVPSSILASEVKDIERKIKRKCTNISFRANDPKMNYYFCLYDNSEVIYRKKAELQKYFYGFLHSIITREGCMNCNYKTVKRVGDISLGDFIGLGSTVPFKPDKEYIGNPSLVLVNTEHGRMLLEQVIDELDLYEREVGEAVLGGPSLRGNQESSSKRRRYREIFKKYGYVAAITRVTRVSCLFEYIKYIYKNTYNTIRRSVKRIITRNRL